MNTLVRDLDAMSEDELEAYLAELSSVSSRQVAPVATAPTGGLWSRWGLATGIGSSRAYGLFTLLASLVGVGASWELMSAEIKLLRDPLADLSCDISPLVACGDTLTVWQGNLLGIPNAFLGGIAFGIYALLGLMLAIGVKLPRLVWWGMLAGITAAMAFVAWFLGVSILTFGKLCPWCMVIWTVTIPLFSLTWGEAAGRAVLTPSLPDDEPPSWALRWYAGRRWVMGGIYAIFLALIIGCFWDGWVGMLR